MAKMVCQNGIAMSVPMAKAPHGLPLDTTHAGSGSLWAHCETNLPVFLFLFFNNRMMSSGLFLFFVFFCFLGLGYTLGIPTGMNKTLQGDKPTRGGRVHGAGGETENIGTNSLMGPQLLRPLHFFSE